MARGGIVTSPHRLASEAGLDILRRGGNAIEASIAISAVLAVTYPHFCGLGGDAVWLAASPNRAPTSFLGIGQAVAAIPRGETIPTRGAGSVLTTACLVESWRHALRILRAGMGRAAGIGRTARTRHPPRRRRLCTVAVAGLLARFS